MSDNSPFTGKGLSETEMTPEERAAHREMFREVSRAWPALSGLNNMIRGGESLGKLIAGATVIGAVIAYAIDAGIFQ